jgi:hypothetical protein
MYNISTLPYFLELDVPFTHDQFFNDQTFNIDINSPVTDFVKKTVFVPEVLNQNFKQYVETIVGAEIRKIVIWYWGNSDLNLAHIDCNDKKEVHPMAINWVLNPQPSQVNFYDKTSEELTIGFGDNGIPNLKTENVTSYIPVDVSGNTPAVAWSTKTLCLLNTSIPHMIKTDTYRISASLQFDIDVKFESVVARILNDQ